ncbi:hypothetical protein BDV98DRAFT_601401 [Pterulicium gracile]|uniref:Uncharacterized protein n=1 Tax=Pterulicium gracile TaxID=1884261 RepID=A0A5C3QSK8_9AGAR|nr:hypothetical protein BDV98DRAFT_601401 [Pterula gracilis]
MTTDTAQHSSENTLVSILCKEPWTWDSMNANEITFNVDGTGKLICRIELNVWIAAIFTWSTTTPEIAPGTTPHDQPSTGGSSHLSQLPITITLTKDRIPTLGSADMSNYTINEALLTDDAFLPKSYIVSLEKGRFITAFDQLGEPRRLEYTPEYALRLTFDRSPYPPREEWRRPEGAPDAMKFWEWREFCGGKL